MTASKAANEALIPRVAFSAAGKALNGHTPERQTDRRQMAGAGMSGSARIHQAILVIDVAVTNDLSAGQGGHVTRWRLMSGAGKKATEREAAVEDTGNGKGRNRGGALNVMALSPGAPAYACIVFNTLRCIRIVPSHPSIAGSRMSTSESQLIHDVLS